MKKIAITVLVSFCILTTLLVGCSYMQEQLATPENVRIEGNTLKWDSVNHTVSYSIYVDDNHKLDVEGCEANLSELGFTVGVKYQISVVAKSSASKYLNSEPSNAVSYTAQQQSINNGSANGSTNNNNGTQNEPTIDVGNTVNYAGGHGTSSSPYKISTKQHFINMIKEETTAGKYYILTNDIDLGDWSQYGITDWTKNVIEPATPFCGNLDGNNKTVTYKVRIAKTSLRTWALGLFPAIKNATIKYLNVNADLSTENLYNAGKDYDISKADRAMDALVGGLTGYAYLSNISNCSVSGRVNWNSMSGEETTCVAGVVGLSRNSNVRNCSNSATIYARGRYLAYSGVIACWYTSDNTKSYGGLSNTGALSYKLREVIETERELYHKNDLVGREGAKILTK